MAQLISRRRIIGGVGAGVAAATVGAPLLGGRIVAAQEGPPPVLPALQPGMVMPTLVVTRQTLGAHWLRAEATYPNPAFTALDSSFAPLGTLSFALTREDVDGRFRATEVVTWVAANGATASRELAVTVLRDTASISSSVAATSGESFLRNTVRCTCVDDPAEVQPTLRLRGGTYSSDRGSRSLTSLPAELKLLASNSEDARHQMRFLSSVEQAAGSVGGQEALDAHPQRMLAAFATDPMVLAYTGFNPAGNIALGGPWTVAGAFVCSAGKFAGLRPAALALWGLGCSVALGGPALDQSAEAGFGAAAAT